MDYQFERLSLDQLDPELRETYALLTEPQYRFHVREKSEELPLVIAIGASLHSQPVGLALATLYPNLGHAEILSLFVERDHRKKQVGSLLFDHLEQACIADGGKVLTFNYRKEPRYGLAYETIFLKKGWNQPKLFMEEFLFDAILFHPPWLTHLPKIPTKYKVFLWKKLKKPEREQIEHDFQQGHFNSIVYPFYEENRIEFLNSVGLRYKKEVLGWSIIHRISLDILRYTALYVKSDLQFTGFSMRLLIDSINLQRPKEATIRWVLVPVNQHELDTAWYRFVKRRLAPYSQATINIFQTWKAF